MSRNVPLRCIWESLRILKKFENETFYFMNIQQRRYIVNLSWAFLKAIVNRFWHKWHQMKAKDLVFRLLKAFYFQKFNHQYFKNGGEKSITSYLGSERLVFYLFSIRLKEKNFWGPSLKPSGGTMNTSNHFHSGEQSLWLEKK